MLAYILIGAFILINAAAFRFMYNLRHHDNEEKR